MVCPCCEACSAKSCSFEPDGNEQFNPVGNCVDNCCCEQLPAGGCYDESIVDEEGNAPPDALEWIVRGKCENCCAEGSPVYFYVDTPSPLIVAEFGDTLAERADEWVANVRTYLEENGFTGITSYGETCHRPGSLAGHLAWVRACCDGTLTCPETAQDCDASVIGEFAPDNQDQLQPGLEGSPGCSVAGGAECLPTCEPNPFP